ncbi:acyltransferase family protein [Nocardia sp. alder85J]|uniref:acyltransferase family protein n=1 Tax=Nocardia sp. alder85J TaxID=2862949 RepID=UPI001CD282DC|nr:acyltransferase [Nocardia sp. alder85J]MCX4094639.1 acyltransferase [Nocardia sp. alder85J]
MSAPRTGEALPALTGARWWAAFAVFVLHALVFLPVYPFQKSALFRTLHGLFPMQLGAAGVAFFFVLSGFVIAWSFRPGTTVWTFYRRRALKIYPTHLAAVAVFVVAAPVPMSRPVTWLPDTLLIQAWVPKWTTVGGLNVPSWSLCSELLFYLSFPAMLPLIRRIPRARLPRAVAVLLLAMVALHIGLHLWVDGPKGIANTFAPRLLRGDDSPRFEIHASPQWFAQPDIPIAPSYWLGYTFPLVRLPEFYLGVLAARLVAEGLWRNLRLGPPLAATALAYTATWWVPVNFKMSVLVVAPMTAVVATLAARDRAGISGINTTGPLRWLGNISYAFYLIQFPVMVILTRLLIGGHRYGVTGWAAYTAATFALSVLAAAALYHCLDQPIMNHFVRRRPQAPPAPAEAADTEPLDDHRVAGTRGGGAG